MIHVPASIFQEHKLKENIRKTNDKSLAFFAGLFYNSNTIIFETQKLLLSEERRYMDYKQFLETVEKKAPAVPEWMKSILIEKEPHVNERVFYSSGC